MTWLLIITGFGTGFLVGLTGVGGGALMTPLLMLLFGLAPQTAVGTDLWFASFTKIAASKVMFNKDLIDWQITKLLWYGSIPATIVTLFWLSYISAGHKDTMFIKQLIAAAILWAGIGLIFQPILQNLTIKSEVAQDISGIQGEVITIVAGAIIGILVTLTSVGAGALGTVVLLYLYPARLNPSRLIATEVAHAIPVAYIGSY